MTYEPGQPEIVLTIGIGHTVLSPFYRNYVRRLGLQGSENVLEYGSGSGTITRYLAMALPKGHLTCVDVSDTWLQLLRKKMRKYPAIDYHRGELHTLNLPIGSYDAVVLHFVLHDVEPQKRLTTLEKMYELLREGGKIFLREPIDPNHGIAPEEVRQMMATCGFAEIKGQTGKVFMVGDLFEAVYEKRR